MRLFLRALIVTVLTAIGGPEISANPASSLSCDTRTFEKVSFIVCSIDLKTAGLRLFWKGSDGEPYRTFANVAKAVSDEGKSLTFAMNAGMYTEDFMPMGLYVEDGEEQRPVNTAKIEQPTGIVPNFYKKPNGVFFIDRTSAGILPTEAFLKRRDKVRFATQSGPMLVIGGKLHPAFIPGSTDRRRRSGVGVCKDATLRFAISDDAVNFHDFARLFRDELNCSDALFLDGGRGAGIYVPTLGREDRSGHGGYGPMVGLIE